MELMIGGVLTLVGIWVARTWSWTDHRRHVLVDRYGEWMAATRHWLSCAEQHDFAVSRGNAGSDPSTVTLGHEADSYEREARALLETIRILDGGAEFVTMATSICLPLDQTGPADDGLFPPSSVESRAIRRQQRLTELSAKLAHRFDARAWWERLDSTLPQ